MNNKETPREGGSKSGRDKTDKKYPSAPPTPKKSKTPMDKVLAEKPPARERSNKAAMDRDKEAESDNEEEIEESTALKNTEDIIAATFPVKPAQPVNPVKTICDADWLHDLMEDDPNQFWDFQTFLSANRKLIIDGQGRADVNYESLQDDWEAFCASDKDTEVV